MNYSNIDSKEILDLVQSFDPSVIPPTTDRIEQLILNKISVFMAMNRKEKKITVRELNKKSRVSLAVITDLENARSMPRVETLIRLSVALGINFNDTFKAMLIPYNDENTDSKDLSQADLATTIANFGYDKNQVQEIIEFIKYIDYKSSNRSHAENDTSTKKAKVKDNTTENADNDV